MLLGARSKRHCRLRRLRCLQTISLATCFPGNERGRSAGGASRAGFVPAAWAEYAASHSLARESFLLGPHSLLATPEKHTRTSTLGQVTKHNGFAGKNNLETAENAD